MEQVLTRKQRNKIRIENERINKIHNSILIGHRYSILKVLPFQQLYDTYADHKRLKVFVQKGLKCVVPGCECEGCLLIITTNRNGDLHVDIYTKNLELMTIDHIIPLSVLKKSGKQFKKYDLENLQPMCQFHNESKHSRQDLGY